MLLITQNRSSALLVCLILAAAPNGQAAVSFNKDIRPILSENCFSCHGPDTAKIKGGLRLDSQKAATTPGKSGALALVPGSPEKSELLKRISSQDEEEVMPPPKAHKKVTPEQTALLKQWIQEGAEYQAHWAFIPPTRPSVPVLKNTPASAAPRNPVDAFVRSRLDKEGLAHAPEAPKETLVRRVHLDLTGLPPTPQQLQSYLRDSSPDAYEKMVDRVLNSSGYGERMAIQWLDFARYADSNGFQADNSRQQWPWRDWTIAAFNRNMPFDRFTIEQLAGDLLPNPSQEQLVATGFNRNHRLNGEGGLIAEEWFVETVIDRVETTGSTWLGLTLNCCRCHDHKFDPISQREFYQFFAFFNSIEETGINGSGLAGRAGNSDPIISLPTEAQQKKLDALNATIQEREAVLAAARPGSPSAQEAWEPAFKARLAENQPLWVSPKLETGTSAAAATITEQPDGSLLVTGKSADKDTLTLTFLLPEGTFSALQIESLNDPSLPQSGPARGGKMGPVLTGLLAEVGPATAGSLEKVRFYRAETDSLASGFSLKSAVGLEKGKGWAVDASKANKPARAVFVADRSFGTGEPLKLTVRLKQENGGSATFGKLRISVSGKEDALVHLDPEKVLAPIKAILAVESEKRNATHKSALKAFYLTNTDNPERRALNALSSVKDELKMFTDTLQSVMVMKEKPQPKEAFLLKRGEYDKKGDPVSRGLPAALPPLPNGAPENRLGLAQWIVSEQNPLTARVWVNRAWERFFGVGIVKTTENFGVQTEWPMHAELLDFLAVEFMNPTVLPPVNGTPAQRWDMKAFQKMLVLSDTYKQSSRVTPELLERDPDNRLLARGPRFRLSGELIRDQALSVSGLLVDKVGGPSVRPYMPEGVWDETSRYGDLLGYKADKDSGLYRRSLYTIWKRTAAPPSMLLFDAPTREVCAVKRSRTNTPLQALSLLNEVTYVEAARALAERMLREGGTSAGERIAWAFQKVTCRAPQPGELAVLEKGLRARLTRYAQAPEEAMLLTSQGASKSEPSTPTAELAAYTLTANVLLNLDETVTRE